MTKVLLFGTFDGLHEGHKTLLRSASAHGEEVIVALALDEVVERLKGRPPVQVFVEREEALQESGLVTDVVPGDDVEGGYAVIDRVAPDLIAFGYDQEALSRDFLEYLKKTGKKIPTVTLEAFEPTRYKSSLLRNEETLS